MSETRSTTPHDRKTRIANDIGSGFADHPEYQDGDRCCVLLYDDAGGGVGLFGYDNDSDAVVDMFMHLRAIVRASGRDLEFIGIPESPDGLT